VNVEAGVGENLGNERAVGLVVFEDEHGGHDGERLGGGRVHAPNMPETRERAKGGARELTIS
jgi:hypothetical protein